MVITFRDKVMTTTSLYHKRHSENLEHQKRGPVDSGLFSFTGSAGSDGLRPGDSGPESGRLGNTAIVASTSAAVQESGQNTRRAARRARYEMQRIAAAYIGQYVRGDDSLLRWSKRRAGCLRYSVPGADIEIRGSGPEQGDSAHHWYHGLTCCDSPYCPHCAPKLANRRAAGLARAIGRARSEGWIVVHMTLTFSHSSGMTAKQSDSALRSALRSMRSGRAWQEFKRAAGLLHSHTTVETTHGSNGYHPHAHVLMIFSPAAAAAAGSGLVARLRDRAERHRAAAVNHRARRAHGRAVRSEQIAADCEQRAGLWSDVLREISQAERLQREQDNYLRTLEERLTGLQESGSGAGPDARALVAELKAARRRGADAEGLQTVLDELWAAALLRSGSDGLRGRRLTASYAPANIGAYLAKFGRAAGIALEAAGAVNKAGRARSSRSMFDLLRAAASGDVKAGRTWGAWVVSVRHLKVYSCTPGFKTLMEPEPEQPEPEQPEPLLIIPPEAWRAVVRARRRAQILDRSELEGPESVTTELCRLLNLGYLRGWLN